MAIVACSSCGASVEASQTYMTGSGEVCGVCHSDLELAESQKKGWITAPNIVTVLFLLGGVSCTIEINGVDYGRLVLAPMSFFAAIIMLVIGIKGVGEPAWLRFGRPALLFLLSLGQCALVLPSALAFFSGESTQSSSSSNITIDGMSVDEFQKKLDAQKKAAEEKRAGLEKGCREKDKASCEALAKIYEVGDGVDEDQEKALGYHEKACDAKDGGSVCNQLGFRYAKGQGVEKDMARAVGLFEKACDGDDVDGCRNAGLIFSKGDGVGVDKTKSLGFFERACELGRASSCNNAGIMHDGGEGTDKDPTKANTYFVKACDKGEKFGCFNLALNYVKGDGVKKDPKRAAAYYGKACGLNHAGSCNNLGVMHERGKGVKKDFKAAVDLFEKACGDKNGMACGNAANFYTKGKGKAVPKDPQKALALNNKACELKYEKGCKARAKACKSRKLRDNPLCK